MRYRLSTTIAKYKGDSPTTTLSSYNRDSPSAAIVHATAPLGGKLGEINEKPAIFSYQPH